MEKITFEKLFDFLGKDIIIKFYEEEGGTILYTTFKICQNYDCFENKIIKENIRKIIKFSDLDMSEEEINDKIEKGEFNE